jgi:hypothetical protein
MPLWLLWSFSFINFKWVGITDLKEPFDVFSKSIPASKMIQENFLQAIGEKH